MPEATLPSPGATPRIHLRAPLVPLEVVRAAQRMNSQEILRQLLENGRLPWVFDVGLGEGPRRREIRVLAKSLEDLQTGGQTFTGDPAEWPAVVRTILPMAPPARHGTLQTLRADTVARQLSIKTTFCLELARAGAFSFAPGAVCRVGPNGSPPLALPTVIAWLKDRRVV